MTPQEFVAKWRGNTSGERQVSQQHFLDLCALVGHQTPAALDPENKFFTFEAGAAKQSGGQGWADVWYRGHFAIEYKGPNGSMEKAYSQLLQYRESLENPPLLIVSNIQTITIHSNFTNSVKRTLTLSLDDLLTPQGLTHLRNIFFNPEAFRPEKTAAQVTEEAAAHFARLADHLRKWGEHPHAIAHYLIRLLFCLFAEDIDLLPRDLFTRVVENGRHNPGQFNRKVRQLFQAMAEGDSFGEHEIRYFDGGLFDDDTAIDMDSDGIVLLHGITQLDWSAIEPAILGTLFTRSLDPSQRAKLGAQYTSREDILLIVEPVLMAPLRREWQHVKQRATELAARRDNAATRAQRKRLANELDELMSGFAHRLAVTRVLDPACGSGNFLYIALRLLLDLWKETSLFAGEVGLSLSLPLPGFAPSPEQLYGIEVNDYAHELAQATVWIGYLQWLHENGYSFTAEPILKPLDTIKLMDAILAYDADGKPVEPQWPEAEVIVGNPPFLGGGKIRGELGNDYTEALFRLYGDRLPNFSDLVCYWFEKARAIIAEDKVQRAGLLATNSIRGGANRTVLQRIKQSGDIFWAQSDRDWVLEGAAVNVSMVGFDNGSETTHILDGRQVTAIFPDLTAVMDMTVALPLPENVSIGFIGPSPKAPFDIDEQVAQGLLTAETSESDHPNSDVVRPLISGIDIVQGNRRKWTIDFGLKSFDEASQYELPLEYVRTVILPIREHRRDDFRGQWWQFARPRSEMRDALSGLHRFIATARIAKHRVFVWLDARVLANDQTVVFARADDYFFGVLHSKPHEIWALRMGTSLEDRPRYTPTTTFETFPFPWPPGKEPVGDPRVEAIAAAARQLVELRDAWLNPPDLSDKELQKRTLTNLYNQRPDWLAQAHCRLDAAVCAAYGWPDDLADKEITARLLAQNLQRAAGT